MQPEFVDDSSREIGTSHFEIVAQIIAGGESPATALRISTKAGFFP